MSHTLKDGSTVEDIRLDRLYQEDWRSLDYSVTVHPRLLPTEDHLLVRKPRSRGWVLKLWLDQLAEGACVGASLAHELASGPVPVKGITMDWARTKVYWEAQKIDEWSGGAYPGASPFYEGTSVLAGAKVLNRYGYYTSYYWALNIQELALGVGYAGPAVLGVNWYEGMFNPDPKTGFLSTAGRLAGGHAIVVEGIKIVWEHWTDRWLTPLWENVDLDRSYLVLHNSWGQSWGHNGRAKLSLRNAEYLLSEQGEALFPVRNPKMKSAA